MHQFGFERLDVWKKSITLNKFVYELSADFPDEERFGLIAQIRRAAISIPANIAEGASRFSSKDQIRFYGYAYGSLMEVLNFIILAKEFNFIDQAYYDSSRSQISEIANKLNALTNSAKGR